MCCDSHLLILAIAMLTKEKFSFLCNVSLFWKHTYTDCAFLGCVFGAVMVTRYPFSLYIYHANAFGFVANIFIHSVPILVIIYLHTFTEDDVASLTFLHLDDCHGN